MPSSSQPILGLLRPRLAPILLAVLLLGCGESAAPVAERAVVVAFQSGPDSLDPVTASTARARSLLGEMLSLTLLRRDPVRDELLPWAAASLEPRGESTLRLRLRPEARFSDGRPLRTEDVAATIAFLRSLGPGAAATAEALVGLDAATVIDELTLDLGLDGRVTAAVAREALGTRLPLLHPSARVADPEARAGAPTLGPYELISRSASDLVIERRRPWWGDDLEVFSGRFAAERLRLRFVLDQDSLPRLLAAGLVDLAPLPAEFAGGPLGEGVRSAPMPSPSRTLILWNVARPPFDRPALRRALGDLVPRAALARDAFAGLALPSRNPFSEPEDDPRRPELAAVLEALEDAGVRDRDGDGAREDRAGTPLSIRLLAPAGRVPWVEAVVGAWRENLRALGLDLLVERLALPALLDRLRSGDFDAAAIVWTLRGERGGWRALFHSSERQGGRNFGGFADDVVDRALETLDAALDAEALAAARRELGRVLVEKAPAAFLFEHRVLVAWRPDRVAFRYGEGGLDLTTIRRP